MRCENLSKRLNRYTILFLIMDLIILLIDLFSCHNHTKFLFLILTIFIINCLFFDFCKKHVAYIKKSIFYIWQFNYVSIPWWRSHPIHKNRATESIWTEPCNPLLRATKSTKRATFNGNPQLDRVD